MSNLGLYQTMTTMAKAVGGPLNLAGCVAGSGALVGAGVATAIILFIGKVAEKQEERQRETKTAFVYTVHRDGKSNEGLVFKTGDQFKVLFVHDDAVLIEKLGDSNNPYFVSSELLKAISDYKPE